MFYRHWVGDLALAVLLVLPLSGVAGGRPATHLTTPKATTAIAAANLSPAGRIGLFG